MAKEDRTYRVVERGTMSAPQNDPILVDKKGDEVNISNPATFNKQGALRKVDHYRIKFVIEDFDDSRLRFAPNASDVLWVKKGGGAGDCPTTACDDLPYEIWVDKMHERGKSIEVINMDLQPTDFWFTLNLVDKNNVSGPFVPVDPPGGNQNGGSAGSGFTFKSITVGAVTGLVVGFGALIGSAGFDAPNLWISTLIGGLIGAIIGFVLDRY